jgi:hypothetical protein
MFMRSVQLNLLRFALSTVVLACLLHVFSPVAAQEIPANPIPFDPTVCEDHVDGSALSDACAEMTAAFPRPPFLTEVPVDRRTISQYSFWKVGPEPTPKFDAPNGNVVSEIPAGYNFVTAIDLSQEGWMQIQGGQWIRSDTATYTPSPEFSGVLLGENTLDHPFAWVLDQSRIFVSEYPGGPWESDTGRWLDRYELVNIFSTAVDDEGWHWYMIGPNHWVEQRFVSKVQRIERPEGVSGRWVAIDLYEQNLVAYEDDTPVFNTLVSSGAKNWDTNEGLFNVWSRLPADGMSGATGAPEAYALQSVPWVMYFDGGISLHGTYWHDLFGYRHSHGCVNLSISDASWLYEWFAGAEPNADGEIVNSVYVWSSGEYGATNSGI